MGKVRPEAQKNTPHGALSVASPQTDRPTPLPDPAPSLTRPRVWIAVLSVLAAFVLAGVLRYRAAPGDDLSSSYVAARLAATGQASSLYAHDPDSFPDVDDPAWTSAADEGGFEGYLHPYVQTPLWAYSLRALAMNTSFEGFKSVFLILDMLCFGGVLWCVARYWAAQLLTPLWIAILAAALFITEPFRYSMTLVQTHVILFFITLLSLILARRGRPVAAGFLLAVAAAIKLTPGFLLLYWLLTRRWKASLSFILSSGAFMILTVLVAGPALTAAYLQEVHRISKVLLIAFNNQSFAAAVTVPFPTAYQSMDWSIYPLSPALQASSLLLLALCTIAGGLLDRRAFAADPKAPPLGAMFAIVGATIFAPIAWLHYYIVLVAPLMLVMAQNLRLRSRLLWVLLAAIFLLDLQHFRVVGKLLDITGLSISRAPFLSGVLCMLALYATAQMTHSRSRTVPASPATATNPN